MEVPRGERVGVSGGAAPAELGGLTYDQTSAWISGVTLDNWTAFAVRTEGEVWTRRDAAALASIGSCLRYALAVPFDICRAIHRYDQALGLAVSGRCPDNWSREHRYISSEELSAYTAILEWARSNKRLLVPLSESRTAARRQAGALFADASEFGAAFARIIAPFGARTGGPGSVAK